MLRNMGCRANLGRRGARWKFRHGRRHGNSWPNRHPWRGDPAPRKHNAAAWHDSSPTHGNCDAAGHNGHTAARNRNASRKHGNASSGHSDSGPRHGNASGRQPD